MPGKTASAIRVGKRVSLFRNVNEGAANRISRRFVTRVNDRENRRGEKSRVVARRGRRGRRHPDFLSSPGERGPPRERDSMFFHRDSGVIPAIAPVRHGTRRDRYGVTIRGNCDVGVINRLPLGERYIEAAHNRAIVAARCGILSGDETAVGEGGRLGEWMFSNDGNSR